MREKYLNILGLKQGATSEEIRIAYKKQALKYHPDKNPNDWVAEEAFKKVQDAYNYLIANTENDAEPEEDKPTDDPMQILAEGTPEEIREAVRNGLIDVDDPRTVFIAVANTNNPDVIRTLCDLGADINCVNSKGITPLIVAVEQNKNPQILETLLELDADVDYESEDGLTPLLVAFRNIDDSTERKIEILLEAEADTNIIQNILILNKDVPISFLKMVMDHDLGIRYHSENYDFTPLEVAITQHCPIETVRFLVENGENVNQTIKSNENYDVSILVNTILNEPIEYVKLLVECGADINFRVAERVSPLLIAIEKSNVELVRYLIKAGATVDNHVTNMVARIDNEEIIQLVKNAPRKNTYGPNTSLNGGGLNNLLAKSNRIWDHAYFWSRNKAKSHKTKRSKQKASGQQPTQNLVIYTLSQLNGAGIFIFIPILFLAFTPSIFLIKANYTIPIYFHLLIGGTLALVMYWHTRGIALFLSPIVLALIVTVTPQVAQGTEVQVDSQNKTVQAVIPSSNKSKKDSKKYIAKVNVIKQNVPQNTIVGNWNPVIENEEEYEPYMLRISSDGSYTIIAEVEANNISGKWHDQKDGTFLFADGASFLTGMGNVQTQNGLTELVISHDGGQASKFTVQN